jgi:hypothetical protein
MWHGFTIWRSFTKSNPSLFFFNAHFRHYQRFVTRAWLALLLATGVLAHGLQILPGNSSKLGPAGTQAVASWVNQNKAFVELKPDATSMLNATFSNEKTTADFEKVLRVQGSPPDDQKTGLLIKSYLSEVRDKKFGECPRLSNCSQQKITIGAADLQLFSFGDFAKGLSTGANQAALRDPGFLSVKSSPPGAAIVIDSQFRGGTDKDFVVSKGKHSLSVTSDQPKVNCKDDVDVGDQPVVYKCPR